MIDRSFCVAPMMGYSHRYARLVWQLLCPTAVVYSEMVTAEAVLHGRHDRLRIVGEKPGVVALQLGGARVDSLVAAAQVGERLGYDEINLNCGCPSVRVRCGEFGACLMRQAGRVAEMVRAMKGAVGVPITVKCRLGVDGMDSQAGLDDFVATVVAAGCDAMIVHARRAWLDGLNPSQNRCVPPLDYERVYRLKEDFPTVPIVLNGGLRSVAEGLRVLPMVDGVMMGRVVCQQPMILAEVASQVFGLTPPSRQEVVAIVLRMVRQLPFAEWRVALAVLPGLFHGVANGRWYRQQIASGTQQSLDRLEADLLGGSVVE